MSVKKVSFNQKTYEGLSGFFLLIRFAAMAPQPSIYSFKNIAMKRLIILCLLFVSVNSIAQKLHNGKLYFVDGKTVDALVSIPKDPGDKKIEYKLKESDAKMTISSGKLKALTIRIDDSTQYEFAREAAKKATSKTKFKVLDTAWLTVLEKGPATLYAGGQAFRVSKRGELVIRGSWKGGVPPDTHFFLKRDGEDNAMWVGFYSPSTAMLDVTFRYWTERYFSDYPQLAERIKNKEFKILQIAEVVRIYNSWKAKSGK